MKRARAVQAAGARWLAGPHAARTGRFALVIGGHLLLVYLLLRVPGIRSPVEARVESVEVTFFGQSGRPTERDLGMVKPKLERLKVRLPLLPEERLPDVPAASAPHTTSVRSDSAVVAALSIPQPGVGAGAAAAGTSDHGILVISRVTPSYPPRALRSGERGTVIIGLEVDPRGELTRLRVVRSSGSRALDQAAAAAVGRWKFRAAAKGGQSIGAWGRVQVNFYATCGSSPRPDQTRDARHVSCPGRSRAAAQSRSPQR